MSDERMMRLGKTGNPAVCRSYAFEADGNLGGDSRNLSGRAGKWDSFCLYPACVRCTGVGVSAGQTACLYSDTRWLGEGKSFSGYPDRDRLRKRSLRRKAAEGHHRNLSADRSGKNLALRRGRSLESGIYQNQHGLCRRRCNDGGYTAVPRAFAEGQEN